MNARLGEDWQVEGRRRPRTRLDQGTRQRVVSCQETTLGVGRWMSTVGAVSPRLARTSCPFSSRREVFDPAAHRPDGHGVVALPERCGDRGRLLAALAQGPRPANGLLAAWVRLRSRSRPILEGGPDLARARQRVLLREPGASPRVERTPLGKA